MTEKMKAKKISTEVEIQPEEIPALFQKEGIDYTVLDKVNWADEFPYKPSVKLGIAHDSESVLLHYIVEEQSVMAKNNIDGEYVHTDSCVEFFCKPDEKGYYNFEFNCIGTLNVSYGKGRHERVKLPVESYKAIRRWASLGGKTFEEKLGQTHWEIAVVIPKEAMSFNDIQSFDSLTMKAGFFKCGDNLQVPHFVTWMPILTPEPDYHRPEYFGVLEFE